MGTKFRAQTIQAVSVAIALQGCIGLNEVAVPSSASEAPAVDSTVDTVFTGASAGGGSCSLDTLTSAADSSHILAGKDALNGSGVRVDGAMVDRGTWNLTTTPFPGSGFFAGITGAPGLSSICSTANFLGSAGLATCASLPTLSVAGTLSWGSITAATTKTITLSIPSAGSNLAKLSFSGTGLSGFKITSVAGLATSITPASGTDTVVGLTYSGQPSATVTFLPVFTDGTAKTMTVSVADAGGTTTSIAADATFTNPIPGISGLLAWYHADGIAQSENSSVTTWPDDSGNANNATQSTAAARPLLNLTAVGGLPGVRFGAGDGTEDNLPLTTRLTTVRTVFMVVQHATGTQDYPFVLGDTLGTYNFHGEGGSTFFYSGGSQLPSLSILNENGTAKISNVASITKSTSPQLITIVMGANATTNIISQGNAAARYWNGWIAELILFDVNINTANAGNINTVECYLGSKYSITLGHGC